MNAGLARVVAVSRDAGHRFSKQTCGEGIVLVAGDGVDGDAHCGKTVRHRSRVAVDPSQPNLRQVHLIHAELLDELAVRGFTVAAGELGENILTRGIDLLGLSTGTRLRIGNSEIEITGLRNPCAQIERFQAGLLAAVLDRAADGSLIRKCGVMAVVLSGGAVRAGDPIVAVAPLGDFQPLAPV
ncbi:MOSC domain-containing protein [Novosphingobium sp.]|uniref:MOSC domain-containing protein n=1 Tax=Novosphingobium sp. TaxID=1874826 RepID=UPI003BA86B33